MSIPSSTSPPSPRPITRVEYEHLAKAGFFDNERVELLDGQIYPMSPQSDSHLSMVGILTRYFVRRLPDGFDAAPQLPYPLSDRSMPEPDLAVVERIKFRHPLAGAVLFIEVAMSSLGYDRGLKARLYAQAGVPEYWVIDADEVTVDVHRQPTATGYRSIERFDRSARIAPLQFPQLVLTIDELIAP